MRITRGRNAAILAAVVLAAAAGLCLFGIAVGTANYVAVAACLFLLATAVMAVVLLRSRAELGTRLHRSGRNLRLARHRLREVQRKIENRARERQTQARFEVTDANLLPLPTPADLASITAASLEEARFPRLARPKAAHAAIRIEEVETAVAPLAASASDGHGAAVRQALSLWNDSLAKGDVASCREALAVLRPLVDAETADSLIGKLDALAHRREQSWRVAFAKHVRGLDYRAALAVGEEMVKHLPGQSVAQDFERLRPLLLDRLDSTGGVPGESSAPANGEKASA